MATKRVTKSVTTTDTSGKETTFKTLSFVTVEDYVDLAVLSQIGEVRNGVSYRPEIFPRDVRDTFLRLRISSGLSEVQGV